jgi:hypothetical protein
MNRPALRFLETIRFCGAFRISRIVKQFIAVADSSWQFR